MNERKLTNIDFQELLPYVEDRAKDFDKSGKGGKSEFIRELVRKDREKQEGQEKKHGKAYTRIIKKLETMSEEEQAKLYRFISEWL